MFPLLGKFRDQAYNHGWAEKGNVVYDGVGNTFFNKDGYYAGFRPVDIRTYSSEQMSEKLMSKKVWGDWD